MKKISTYNSGKIKIVSLLSIIMVLYIHSWYTEAESYAFSSQLQVTVTQGLCAMAVPMFFTISGFLFFQGVAAVKDVFRKQRKRISTLMLPYILWNLIFMLWYFAMGYIPGISQYVNSDMVGKLLSCNFLDGFNMLFIEPAGFHLWFLRDLILFVTIAPLIFYCIRYTKWLLPAVCAVVSLKYPLWNGLAFFSVGGGFRCTDY